MGGVEALVILHGRGNGEAGALSAGELNALACARTLCGLGGFAVASLGGTEAVVREAVAFGARRAFLLLPEQGEAAFRSAAEVTGLLRLEGFPLAFCADRARNGEGALFGSCLAGEMGWEIVHGAGAMGNEDGAVAIERATGGQGEVIRADPPLVVTFTPGAGEPRAPLAGVLRAASITVEVIHLTSAIPGPAPTPLRFQAAAPTHLLQPPEGASVRARVASMSGRARASAPEPEALDPHRAAVEILAAIREALGQ